MNTVHPARFGNPTLPGWPTGPLAVPERGFLGAASGRTTAGCRMVFLFLVLTSNALTQDFRIDSLRLQSGAFVVRFSARIDSYYRLQRGNDPAGITNSIDLILGTDRAPDTLLGLLQDFHPPTEHAYYRVERFLLDAPTDSDGDRMDDVFELRYHQVLNPLDARDADQDPDGDGYTNTEEFAARTDPSIRGFTTVKRTSPESGEAGVAVTRESILHLSQPLHPDTVLEPRHLFATFGSRKLLARTEVSSDHRTLTLFYLERLPGSARIRVTFEGDGIVDHLQRPLDPDGDGVPGGTRWFEFDTLSTAPVPQTAVTGVVYASSMVVGLNGVPTNQPLKGVQIEVVGAEEVSRATTDGDGRFLLTPSPTGRFFVQVDGRTAEGSRWPEGPYYPVVGKAWDGVAGETVAANGTGEIFLPLVPAGSLRSVSPVEEQVVQLPKEIIDANPGLSGLEVRVPANTLFADNGLRGGRIGMAVVAPDRLPEPLPPGLNFPLVVTIQTDGPQNFDQPLPVRFPNLPDPQTGLKLPPGSRTALWSFNHDTGRWEVQGSMTISADGNFAETDPGVGVRQPGWHGVLPAGRGHHEAPWGPPPPNGLSVTTTPSPLPPIPRNPAPAPAALPNAPAAENPPADCRPQSGRHYWALECLYPSSSTPVQRGLGAANGTLNDNFILAPGSYYRLWAVQEGTGWIGFCDFTTPGAGFDIRLPRIVLHRAVDPDTDQDGISDRTEFVVGTSASQRDTDQDGVDDGAELARGGSPLNSKLAATGIIYSHSLGGEANSLCVKDDRAIVALGLGGIVVFSAADRRNPVCLFQQGLPGFAADVDAAGDMVVVALGVEGLAVVDISRSPLPKLLHLLHPGASVTSVAMNGPQEVLVGLGNGQVVWVDIVSGVEISRITLEANQPVLDLEPVRDCLLALQPHQLFSLSLGTDDGSSAFPSPPTPASQVALTGEVNSAVGRNRVASDGRFAYASHRQGYHILDLLDPKKPQLIRSATFPMFGWKQVVPTGTGLGLAVASPNEALDGPHDLYLYDLRTDLPTVRYAIAPGIARAVSLYDGLAFLVSHRNGFQVVNFQGFDAEGIPPTLSLTTSVRPEGIEEGHLARIYAQAGDDVQVARVELSLNGQRRFSDGSPPYTFAFPVPARSELVPDPDGEVRLRLLVTAIDTGGNRTSANLEWKILTDRTGPRLISTTPTANSIVGGNRFLLARFNEPIDPASLTSATLSLIRQGPNGDLRLLPANIEPRDAINGVRLTFPQEWSPGRYEFTVQDVRDRSGNVLPKPASVRFRVIQGTDSDLDGVPDSIEASLGLSPNNSDTDLDGIPDGQEDFDGDRVPNSYEFLLGYDPRNRDSDRNGAEDGDEDPDLDALPNWEENVAGTDPLVFDTDSDGWNDEVEFHYQGHALNRSLIPSLLFAGPSAPSAISSSLFGSAHDRTWVGNAYPGQPGVQVVSVALPQDDADSFLGTVVARPVVETISSSVSSDSEGRIEGVWIGIPWVQLALPTPAPSALLAPAALNETPTP